MLFACAKTLPPLAATLQAIPPPAALPRGFPAQKHLPAVCGKSVLGSNVKPFVALPCHCAAKQRVGRAGRMVCLPLRLSARPQGG